MNRTSNNGAATRTAKTATSTPQGEEFLNALQTVVGDGERVTISIPLTLLPIEWCYAGILARHRGITIAELAAEFISQISCDTPGFDDALNGEK